MAKRSAGGREGPPAFFLASPRHPSLSQTLPHVDGRNTARAPPYFFSSLAGRKNPAPQPGENGEAGSARGTQRRRGCWRGLAGSGAGPAETAAPLWSEQSFSGRCALGVAWDRDLSIWSFFASRVVLLLLLSTVGSVSVGSGEIRRTHSNAHPQNQPPAHPDAVLLGGAEQQPGPRHR